MGNCVSEQGELNFSASLIETDGELLPTFLTVKELNLIKVSWPLAHHQHPHLCAFILLETFRQSAKIRQIFDVSQEDLLTGDIHSRITDTANAMENFINNLLIDPRSDRVVQMCTELGAKHVAHRKSGFQPVFWDIFTASMTDVFKSVEVKGEQNQQVVDAWQKFWKFVVGTMWVAYELEAKKTDADQKEKKKRANKTVCMRP